MRDEAAQRRTTNTDLRILRLEAQDARAREEQTARRVLLLFPENFPRRDREDAETDS